MTVWLGPSFGFVWLDFLRPLPPEK
jgi:hypothetical protein